jgi:hypothetical protein
MATAISSSTARIAGNLGKAVKITSTRIIGTVIAFHGDLPEQTRIPGNH